ncbi:MAG: OmpH family outer membrane protein [Flavobacteriales bacterium]|jgi:outer membrane protein|nr:OmpH family outer membrane protein [Flavobacteriales bacterium]MBT6013870.1 OmpH family outer membrane protein [Flavobacteriales bacterium]MBT7481221.1 OmpH family outer membrane protein [Flavobacteriales bacterium]
MKKLAILALFGLLTFNTFAQKLGHLDAQEILALMPEREKATEDYQEYAKGLESQLMSMQSEYQSEIQDYQDNEATYSDLVKQDKIAEIQGLEQRIGTFQQSAQESLQRKEVELLSPILEKLQNAINEVAEDGDYTYIFDNNTGGMLLYSKESENISSLVKKKLGL